MKNLLVAMVLAPLMVLADTEVVDGIEWEFVVVNGAAQVQVSDYHWDRPSPSISDKTIGKVSVPSVLGQCPVVLIGENAFHGCRGLTSIIIPECVKRISNNAFDGCEGLMEIVVATENSCYCSEGGILYTKDKKCLFRCPAGKRGAVTIPEGVTRVGSFAGCSMLTSVVIPASLIEVDDSHSFLPVSFDRSVSTVFSGCTSLVSITVADGHPLVKTVDDCILSNDGKTLFLAPYKQSVTIPSGVMNIFHRSSNLIGAFEGHENLEFVTVPASVTSIGEKLFSGCGNLQSVRFLGNAPVCDVDAFRGCPQGATAYVSPSTKGWMAWNGLWVVMDGEDRTSESPIVVTNVVEHHHYITVTNVVVNYVLNSVRPEIAVPATSDARFVNIIAEVKGRVVSVPESWAKNYPNFVSKFGSDFTKALAMKTGKKDGAGNEMLVWQDYVAGTDPTNEKDVFTASITIVDGKVTISYSPELDDARKSMRKYTTWGKTSLMDTDWTEVQDGHEAEYNFFKVSVEMR